MSAPVTLNRLMGRLSGPKKGSSSCRSAHAPVFATVASNQSRLALDHIHGMGCNPNVHLLEALLERLLELFEESALPSLNSNGSKISYRRKALIGDRPDHRKFNPLLREKTQGLRRYCSFARRPTLAREPWDEFAQRALFSLLVWKPDEDLHDGEINA